MRQEKELKIGEKEYKIKEVPPIEAQKYKLIELSSKHYRISKMDVFDTRKLCFVYPITMFPKIGEYEKNEEVFKLLMKYVEVKIGDVYLPLNSDEMIRQHVAPMDSFTLEKEVVDLTTGFFTSGKLQDYTTDILAFVLQNLITTLTESLEQSSPVEKQP